ncbi:MAG: ComF family protein [Candidatus Omnitrophica bacterium]|nr:ComF family protein [Candidatus Omnitrophota bacterium]MBU2044303.1 ComF family protein [Candidatus Omnitrophota bacterium]MBU2266337.1 ComF family protein [Candidatus Omnitrophota bacterium]MBU2473320.1 ComF family protein [Candidatus Omnitrophota bacterium]
MFKKYLKAFRDLLFPLTCFSCQKKIESSILCNNCQEKISFLKPPLCLCCSQPIAEADDNTCKACREKPVHYQKVISAAKYQEPLSSLIGLFKYQHCDYLGGFLSRLMIQHFINIGFSKQSYDCLIAVPMHPHRLKTRGYNQAEILAGFLSNHFKIPLRNDIIRVAEFRPNQVKLSRAKRQENTQKMFIAAETVKSLNLLLIDDIFTTGATVAACAQSLKEKGAGSITVLTLAKTIGG